MHLRLCLCAELVPLALRTRVLVLSTEQELKKTTNTGRLVPLTLMHGEVRLDETLPDVPPRPNTLVLFPGNGSRELTRADAETGPVTLLVPDGTWRKARKLAARTEGLAELPHVHLPPGLPSRYRLRSHPKASYLATFEAIARALGILENDALQVRLEHVLTMMIERTLWSRGQLRGTAVTGGIPAPLRLGGTVSGETTHSR